LYELFVGCLDPKREFLFKLFVGHLDLEVGSLVWVVRFRGRIICISW